MTNTRRSQLDAASFIEDLGGKVRINLVGTLALLGTLLLFIGVSLSSAGVLEESVLPNILKQLKQQGKQVKSTAILNNGTQSQITVVCGNGETRKYNALGQITEIKDAQGKLTRFENGLAVEERGADGSVLSKTEYVRSESGRIKQQTKHSANGVETKLFDEEGNIVQSNDSHGTKMYGHYVKDGEGHTLSYQEVDLTTNKATRVILNPETGEVTDKIDENGVRTKIAYQRDGNGEVTGTVERDSNGNVTEKKFANGQMVEMIKNGISTKYENVVDASGRLVEAREKTVTPSDRGPIVETSSRKFDQAGRLTEMRDKDGLHTYSYVLRDNGKIASRTEDVSAKQGTKTVTRKVVTKYDETGRVTSVDEGDKATSFAYTFDAKGNVLTSTETKSFKINNKIYTEVSQKQFDGRGNILKNVDGQGKSTNYTYDAKGNRTSIVTPDSRTDFQYDKFGNLKSSITTEKKSVTFTEYEKDGKTIASKTKVLKNGFVEVTSYGTNNDGERVAITREQFGIRRSTMVSSESEQPRESILVKYNGKIITTNYEYAGDHMVSSKEVSAQGVTETQYNLNGKPETSKRVDRWGKTFTTNFEYVGGKMTGSVEIDKQGKTTTICDGDENPKQIKREFKTGKWRDTVENREYNAAGEVVKSTTTDRKGVSETKFDQNGMAVEVKRKNKHGFPRENTVKNVYDAGGDLKESFQTDKRGNTHNYFDGDGLMSKSERVDIYGFPKKKTTTYNYEAGELANSREDDDRGVTTSKYNAEGLMTESKRLKKYGYPREENTTYQYNDDGYMTSSKETDVNGFTVNTYNEDELSVQSVRENNYGHARKQTTTFKYDEEGFMTTSNEKDLRGETDSEYNKDGLCMVSKRKDVFGLSYGRNTTTRNEYDGQGFLTVSHSKNMLSTTDVTYDKDNLARKTESNDVFGLIWGRHKVTADYEYDDQGHITQSLEKDKLGTTLAKYDRNGDAVDTLRSAATGIKFSRETQTKSTFDLETGLITGSVATNKYSKTTTFYDSKQPSDISDGTYGIPVKSITENNYGIGANRKVATQMKTNLKNGLTQHTSGVMSTLDGKVVYGTSETWTDDAEGNGEYGITTRTKSVNNFGLGFTRQNEAGKGVAGTALDVDANTGLTKHTLAKLTGKDGKGEYGTSESWTDASVGGFYGIAIHTKSTTNYGLGFTRQNEAGAGVNGTELEVDENTGLTKHTLAKLTGKDGKGEYGTSESWTDATEGGTYGIAIHTKSTSNYGLGFTRQNEAGKGVAGTALDVDEVTGLTKHTLAKLTGKDGVGDYGTSESWTDASEGGTYGIAIHTKSQSNYGLGFTRQNEAGKGVGGTALEVDENTGLTKHTLAKLTGKDGVGDYGTSESWTDASEGGTYGMAIRTKSQTNYGLGFTRQNEAGKGVAGTALDVDSNTGLTKHTLAKLTGKEGQGDYGTSESWTDASKGGTYGIAIRTKSQTNYGLGFTRQNEAGEGVEGTALEVDENTGLTKHTLAKLTGKEGVGEYGTSESWTDASEGGSYGIAIHTKSTTNYGLGFTRRNEAGKGVMGTGLDVDPNTGLTLHTLTKLTSEDGKSEYGTSESWTDAATDGGTYGVATHTKSLTNYGLGFTRQNEAGKGVAGSVIDIDVNTGLTKHTLAKLTGKDGKGEYGTSESWTDASEGGTYGYAIRTKSTTNYGLGFTRQNEAGKGVAGTQLEVDSNTGLTKHTLAKLTGKDGKGEYGSSESWTDASEGGTYGYAIRTKSTTNYGLGFTRQNEAGKGVGGTALEVDKNTGLTTHTLAKLTGKDGKGEYGTSESWTDASEGGTYGIAIHTKSKTNYGLGFTRQNEAGKGVDGTALEVDENTGLTKHTLAKLTGPDGKGEYGTSESWTDASEGGTYGIAIHTKSKTNYGLGFTRQNEAGKGVDGTALEVDENTGLTKHTLAKLTGPDGKGEYGTSESWTDATEGGTYGIAIHTKSNTNYGLGFTRQNEAGKGVEGTALDIDPNTGLTKHTLAKLTGPGGKGEYGTSESWTDATEGGTYGIAIHTKSKTNYGLGFTRQNEAGKGVEGTALEVDPNTGLTTHTLAKLTGPDGKGEYGTSESWTDASEGGTYGIAIHTKSNTNYGLGFTRQNEAGKGVEGTALEVDPNTGLTTHTLAKLTGPDGKGEYGTSESWTDASEGGTYGIAIHTKSLTNYGLGFTRQNEAGKGVEGTALEVDPNTGLTTHTLAKLTGADGKGEYGTSESWTDASEGGTYGIAIHTKSLTNYGLGFTRQNEAGKGVSGTVLDVDANTGLTKHTLAKLTGKDGKGEYGTSESWTDASEGGTYGIAIHTKSLTNYGLGFTRQNEAGKGIAGTALEVDANTGLTKHTLAKLTGKDGKGEYGSSESWTDASEGGTYGIAIHTKSKTNYGLGFTRQNEAGKGVDGTALEVDPDTGLTKHTLAKLTGLNGSGEYGTSESWTDASEGGTYGIAIHTKSQSNYGLGFTRQNEAGKGVDGTALEVDPDTGLTKHTLAKLTSKDGSGEYGTSESWTDASEGGTYGIAIHTKSQSNYGLGFSRQNEAGKGVDGTILEVDPDTGLTKHTLAKLTSKDGKGVYGTSESWTDAMDGGTYGIVTKTISENNYGLGFTRHTETKVTANKDTGLNETTVSVNKYGTTTTTFDAATGGTYGIAKSSVSDNNFGLGASRHTTTTIDASEDTGLNKTTISENAYGKTTTTFDAATGGTYGIAVSSISDNNFGLGATRHTETVITASKDTGLNEKTVSDNAYGKTTTTFDAATGGTYGIAVGSISDNNFGLGATRHTETVITASEDTGLNEKTVATNAYGKTTTVFKKDSYGLPDFSDSENNFGLGATRKTHTVIKAKEWNGLNESTVATNDYGTTTTTFKNDSYGLPEQSISDNNFGLGTTRHTTTKITAKEWNGLNEKTVATNDYGTTTTTFKDDSYGLPEQSVSDNNYGLGATRHTTTQITAKEWNGLNEKTVATNAYGTTTTTFKDDTYGLPMESVSDNNFGLGTTRHTTTKITAKEWNGLNETTVATNDYGTTTTTFKNDSYGLPEKSVSDNNYGLGATRHTTTKIKAKESNGLNESTEATNDYGTTVTTFKGDSYGLPEKSVSDNKFGLGATRHTTTTIKAKEWNGLNESTVAVNDYGTTTTTFKGDSYGLPEKSVSDNKFGLGATRHTTTTITAKESNGLNEKTVAVNDYGTTTTTFKGDTYGLPEQSVSDNNYGLGATRHTTTQITAKEWNGLNEKTVASNAYGTTTTTFKDDSYGLPMESVSDNNFGLGTTRHTTTKIKAKEYNGLNESTEATNDYGKTTTTFKGDSYGLPEKSVSDNNYGLGATRHTTTTITAKESNGLNEKTVAVNDYGTTTTTFKNDTFGLPQQSISDNKFGLGATRHTTTTITAREWNGLNEKTVAVNDYGTTTTTFKGDSYGLPAESVSDNKFGLGATRHTTTTITAKESNGLNEKTVAVNDYGTTTTTFKGDTYGLPEQSVSDNHYGLGATRHTTTTIKAKEWNGLNESTVASNAYGTTTTTFKGDSYGLPEKSVSDNNFGLGYTTHTTTTIKAKESNGLNESTEATNEYGTTKTTFKGDSYGLPAESVSDNKYGLGATQHTTTTIKAFEATGLNESTEASNGYGTTKTTFKKDTFGLPDESVSDNRFGLGATLHTTTKITANEWNGLTSQTVATNDYSVTTTTCDGAKTGVALSAKSNKKYGLTGSRNDTITYDPNYDSGIAKSVFTSNSNGTTTQWNDKIYGIADPGRGWNSHSHANYGYGGATETDIYTSTNTWSGLPTSSRSKNSISTSETTFDGTGCAVSVHTVNNYGPKSSRDTTTTNTVDHFNGITTSSVCSGTTTTYDGNTGHALRSSNSSMTTIITASSATGITSHTSTTYTSSPVSLSTTDCSTQTGISYRMDNTYSSGASFHWTYTDGVTVKPLHTAANITYTSFLGFHNSAGGATETYDSSYGLLATRRLNNTKTWGETLSSFGNNGDTVTGLTGSRDNGVPVKYMFKLNDTRLISGGVGQAVMYPAPEVETMYDDKGQSDFDADLKILGTSGDAGFFTYEHSGAMVSKIKLECSDASIGKSVEMDQYYNWLTWVDNKNITKTRSAILSSTGPGGSYVTSAKYTFIVGGATMEGTITFDAKGFYSTKSKIIGKTTTYTNLTTKMAGDTTEMKIAEVQALMKQWIAKDFKAADGFSYGSYDSYTEYADPHTTKDDRGNLMQKLFFINEQTLTGKADVIYDLLTPESGTVSYKNIEAKLRGMSQHMRYKPKSAREYVGSGQDEGGVPADEMGEWNAKKNKPYNSSVVGYEYEADGTVEVGNNDGWTDNSTVPPTEHAETHHTEYKWKKYKWSKEADGLAWEFTGTTPQLLNVFAEEALLSVNNYSLGPDLKHMTKGNASASGVAAPMHQTSMGNKSVGAALNIVTNWLSGLVPTKDHGATAAVKATAASAPAEVKATGVLAPVLEPVPQAQGDGAVTAKGKTGEAGSALSDAAQALQALTAKLLEIFSSIQGMEDAAKLVQAALAKMSGEEILQALSGSSEGINKLLKALVSAYKAVFGGSYNQALLTQIVDAVSKAWKLEPVKLALLGGDAVPADVKLAAQKEQEFKDAQSVTRDENGNVVEAIDKAGNQHQFSYDETGVTETVTDPKGKVAVRHMDKDGRLLSENSAGRSVTYSYTLEQGKVKQTQAQERTAEGTANLLYNEKNQLVSVEANGKKKTFAYEGEGKDQTVRVSTQTSQGQLLEEQTFKGGRLVEVKSQDGTKTSYEYMSDASGKVLAMTMTIEDKDGGKTFLKYNEAGRLVSAMGKDKNRFEKMDQEGTIAEQVSNFEMDKQLFSDPRMDGMRIDNKLQLQQLQGPQQ